LGCRRRRVVGFYKDEKKRTRPITARKRRRIRVYVPETKVSPTVIHRGGKEIHRKGYTREAYTYYRKDVGAPGRGKKVIPELEEGELTKHGYSTDKPAKERHEALRKAVREDGAEVVWHRLHAQVILRKRIQPKQREIFRQDRDWVKKTFKPDLTPRAAIKEWRSMSPEERAKVR